MHVPLNTNSVYLIEMSSLVNYVQYMVNELHVSKLINHKFRCG